MEGYRYDRQEAIDTLGIEMNGCDLMLARKGAQLAQTKPLQHSAALSTPLGTSGAEAPRSGAGVPKSTRTMADNVMISNGDLAPS